MPRSASGRLFTTRVAVTHRAARTRCAPCSRTRCNAPRPRTVPAAKATIMLHGGRSTPADAGPSNGVDEQEAGGSATSLHTLPTAMTYRMNPRRFGGGRQVLDNRHGPTVAALPSLVHPGALQQQDRHSSRGRDAIWRRLVCRGIGAAMARKYCLLTFSQVPPRPVPGGPRHPRRPRGGPRDRSLPDGLDPAALSGRGRASVLGG